MNTTSTKSDIRMHLTNQDFIDDTVTVEMEYTPEQHKRMMLAQNIIKSAFRIADIFQPKGVRTVRRLMKR